MNVAIPAVKLSTAVICDCPGKSTHCRRKSARKYSGPITL